MARNTLAHANVLRDWRIYADFAQHLIGMARRLYVQEPFGVRLQQTVYALDITTFDHCLPVPLNLKNGDNAPTLRWLN